MNFGALQDQYVLTTEPSLHLPCCSFLYNFLFGTVQAHSRILEVSALCLCKCLPSIICKEKLYLRGNQSKQLVGLVSPRTLERNFIQRGKGDGVLILERVNVEEDIALGHFSQDRNAIRLGRGRDLAVSWNCSRVKQESEEIWNQEGQLASLSLESFCLFSLFFQVASLQIGIAKNAISTPLPWGLQLCLLRGIVFLSTFQRGKKKLGINAELVVRPCLNRSVLCWGQIGLLGSWFQQS